MIIILTGLLLSTAVSAGDFVEHKPPNMLQAYHAEQAANRDAKRAREKSVKQYRAEVEKYWQSNVEVITEVK